MTVEYDTNVHYLVRGNTDINSILEELIEYLVTTDDDILKIGNVATFCSSRSTEALYIILCSRVLIHPERGRRVIEPLWVIGPPGLAYHSVMYLEPEKEAGLCFKPKAGWASYTSTRNISQILKIAK